MMNDCDWRYLWLRTDDGTHPIPVGENFRTREERKIAFHLRIVTTVSLKTIECL